MNFGERVTSHYNSLVAGGAGPEKAFRKEAWEKFAALGLPTRKTETWKYTVLKTEPWDFAPMSTAPAMQLPKAATELMSTWSKDFDLVMMVDGTLRTDMSAPVAKPLAFGAFKLNFEDGWSGLASAVARPGFSLHIEGAAAKPILIIHVHTSASTWSPVVNHISLAQAASLQLAEIHLGVDQPYLRSEITAVDLAENSVLDYVRVQRETLAPSHYSEVQSRLQAGSVLNLTQLHGGAAWCRSSLRAEILGERAAAHLAGLTFARGKQHIDQRVEVRHAKGFSESTQLFKGVLKDYSRGVLNGKILIERDAQKVSSMQLNHNLLLSKTAEADTKPELEIYADDVKANHGASIGRLDEDEMFYLMSRGITRPIAQQMLAHAFVGDVLMKIGPKTLRRFADACVQSWLPDFSADMEHSLDGVRV